MCKACYIIHCSLFIVYYFLLSIKKISTYSPYFVKKILHLCDLFLACSKNYKFIGLEAEERMPFSFFDSIQKKAYDTRIMLRSLSWQIWNSLTLITYI